MALFCIDRNLGDATVEEIDAAAFRATACLPHFDGMRWLRSFYDAGARRMTCYYQASSAADIRKHAVMSRVACDSVTEVTEYLPDSYR